MTAQEDSLEQRGAAPPQLGGPCWSSPKGVGTIAPVAALASASAARTPKEDQWTVLPRRLTGTMTLEKWPLFAARMRRCEVEGTTCCTRELLAILVAVLTTMRGPPDMMTRLGRRENSMRVETV